MEEFVLDEVKCKERWTGGVTVLTGCFYNWPKPSACTY